ncbi:MAG: glycoside hydrolase family 3 C-terminal domain-containing protein, partial [Bacteroidaceae bacterium]|nr:glycoside hydrolase family 3 C-terminal domain-containing protein [Bacteroidaceae bacterium]
GKAQIPVYQDETKPIEERVKDALSRMTMEEKVNMCHGQSKFSSPGCPRLGIPELWMSDGPHGVREEIQWGSWSNAGWTNDSCTAFPALTCLAATWNPAMAAIYGQAIGEEARFREKDILLGPGVNIYRTPLNGRNFEYMGEDPYLASQMVVPYVQELQKNGVAACVKHYALNNQELQRWNIDVIVSERAMYEIYLPAFRAAVQEGGAWSIMGAYNKILGTHACHNDLTLNKILKDEWGFDGVVVSDWSGTHNTLEAALNGLDIEMGTDQRPDKNIRGRAFQAKDCYLGEDLLALLREGKVSEEQLDDKAARILRLIFRTSMNTQKPFGNMDYAAHSKVARTVGGEGIVLMQNNPIPVPAKRTSIRNFIPLDVWENPLLPIDPTRYEKILVVGDNATRRLCMGGGSSELKVQHETSVLDAMKAKYGSKISYTLGYQAGRTMYGSVEEVKQSIVDSLRNAAVKEAREADLIIFVGGLNKNRHQDCEDGDRLTYDLPFGQNELLDAMLKVNPRVVTVLVSGNAVRIPFPDRMPAILQSWYIGSEIGPTVVDVLSGDVNPSGKLPFSFPATLEDCGAHAFGEIGYPGDGVKVEYKEDILVGYRWHDTKKRPARYPFGHGLSYTTFAYGKPTLSGKTIASDGTLTLTLNVTNTGTREGKEVVQLYIGDDKATVLRPVKELKGFEKIALAPGETKQVTFTITPDMLKYWSEEAHDWVAETGKFTAYIGSSSTDIRGKVTFSY